MAPNPGARARELGLVLGTGEAVDDLRRIMGEYYTSHDETIVHKGVRATRPMAVPWRAVIIARAGSC